MNLLKRSDAKESSDDSTSTRLRAPSLGRSTTNRKISTADAQEPSPDLEKVHIAWHQHPLTNVGTTRDSGWSCSGMLTLGGCRGGCDPEKDKGFGQTYGWDRYRCTSCDYDLCEQCVEGSKSESKLRDRLDKLTSKEQEYDSNIKQVQQKYEALLARTAVDKDMGVESEKLKTEKLVKLTAEADVLRSRIDEVNKCREEDRRKNEGILKEQAEQFEQQLRELTGTRDNLQQQLTDTTTKLGNAQEETETQKASLRKLEDNLQEIKEEKWKLQTDLSKTQKEADILKDLMENNEDSSGAMKEELAQSLKAMSSSISVKMEDIETRMKDLQEREQQLLTRADDAQEQVDALRVELSDKNTEHHKDAAEHSKKITKIRVRLNFEKLLHGTTKTKLITEKESHEQEVTELKSGVSKAESTGEELKTSVTQLTTRLEMMKSQISQSGDHCQSLQRQLDDSQSTVRELQEKLLASKDDMKVLGDSIDQVEQSMTTVFEERINAMQANIFDKPTCKLMDLKSFGKELDSFLADKERLEEIQSETTELSEKLEKTETNLSLAKLDLKKTNERRIQAEKQLALKTSEAASLQENMESLQQKLAKAVPSFQEFQGYQLDRDSDEKEVKFGSKDSQSYVLKWSRTPESFKAEVEMLELLQGECAPQLVESYETDHVIVMQRGLLSLKQYLGKINRKHIIRDIGEFNALLSQFVRCIKILQQKEIVHCCLRPEHFYIFGHDGRWRVIDYSQATYENSPIKLSQLRSILYACPEIVAAQEGIVTELLADTPQDMWSLGVILFECIVGRTFFKDEDAARAELLKIYETKEIDLSDVPEHEGGDMIKNLLNPDPKKRGTLKDVDEYLSGKTVQSAQNSQMMDELKKINEAVKEVESLKQMSLDIQDSILESKEEVLASISEVANQITKLSDQTSKLGLMMIQKIGDNFPRMFVMFPTTKEEMSLMSKLKSPVLKSYKLFLVCEGDGAEGSTCHLTKHEGYEVDITQGWVRKSLPAIKMGLDLFSKSQAITGVGIPFFGSLMDFLPSDVTQSMEDATEYIESVCENLEGIEEYLEELGDTIEEHEDTGVFDAEEKLDGPKKTTKTVAQMLEEKAQNDPDELRKCLTDSTDAIRSMLKDESDPTGGLQQVMVRASNEVIWVCEKCSQSDHVVGFDLREPEQENNEEEKEGEGEKEKDSQDGDDVPSSDALQDGGSSIQRFAAKLSSKMTSPNKYVFILVLLVVLSILIYYGYGYFAGGYITVVRTTNQDSFAPLL